MKKTVLYLLYAYRKYFSPKGNHCRFSPTCSAFVYEAVDKYGTIKGLLLGIRRLLKCHPFSKGGFDPVN